MTSHATATPGALPSSGDAYADRLHEWQSIENDIVAGLYVDASRAVERGDNASASRDLRELARVAQPTDAEIVVLAAALRRVVAPDPIAWYLAGASAALFVWVALSL